MSTIKVDENFCKGCALCVNYCSKKVLGLSTKRNNKGYAVPEAVDADQCIACGICEQMCPEFAITVLEEEKCEQK